GSDDEFIFPAVIQANATRCGDGRACRALLLQTDVAHAFVFLPPFQKNHCVAEGVLARPKALMCLAV
ncbi:hypothetical protein, partial [Mesorhizobium sp.]|uniref:hypothetical protein n=1 Tax=Mesorhizobium sp. TaxID=1871066 RepID=UPI0025B7CB31